MAITDLYNQFEGEDQKHFKESREQLFHTRFSQIPGDREVNLNNYYKGIEATDKVLANSKFLDGEELMIHDYTLTARIQCFRMVGPKIYKDIIINNPNPNFKRCISDMDNIFDGYLAKRKL